MALRECLACVGLLLAGAACAADAPQPAPQAEAAHEKDNKGTPDDKHEPAWDDARIARLITELTDENYSVRQRAQQTLTSAPPSYMRALLKAGHNHDDPDAQRGLMEAAHGIFLGQVVKQLPQYKSKRGFLGIAWQVQTNPPGVEVTQVIAETGAEKAELKTGDLIVKIDRQPVTEDMSMEQVARIWRSMAPGDKMKLEIQRNGETLNVEATIGEVPPDYRSQGDEEATENPDRAESLWARYLQGDLEIPEAVMGGKTSAEKSAEPAASAHKDVTR